MLRIGGKATRGVKGSRNAICDGYKNIDVTSGSRVKIGAYSGRDFSPIVGNLRVIDDGREFQQFENWWQGNKAYKHLNHIKKRGSGSGFVTTNEFKHFQDKWAKAPKGKRTPPEIKLNGTTAKPVFGVYDGKQYGYAAARWQYTAKYCEAVKKTGVFWELAKILQNGENIMLIDHDAPSSKDNPQGISIDWNTIDEKLNDLRHPYGHGYIIAAMLLNVSTSTDFDCSDE